MGPRPDLHPKATDSTEGMRRLQGRITEAAVFADDIDDPTPVAGVDQAFPHAESIVSAAVTMDDGIIEESIARATPPIGYVPGLLAFREGAAAITALEGLEGEPGVVLVDGNGRIHPRQAGLATHIGVVLDIPTVGVAKSLLCGEPTDPIDDLTAGEHVPIKAGYDLEVPEATIIGHAVQTRQFEGGDRHVNPIFVSPGHRISADTAVDLVLDWCDGYKLPEPLRRADAAAGQAAADPKDEGGAD